MKLRTDIYVFILLLMIFLASCQKDIDIKVPRDDEKIVVEAYINNLYTNLNYVIITKTINYFNPDFSLKGFGNATVKINEGNIITPGDTVWKQYALVASPFLQGYYNNDTLTGKVGYVYKLEIWLNNEYYYSLTTIPQLVPIDSLTREIVSSNNVPKAFLTVHFNEPQSLGQNYRVMYRMGPDPGFLAWGDIGDSAESFFNDDFGNGVYQHFTYSQLFNIGDTLQYYLANMDRRVYNFWDSYERAKNNGGPFATPIQLKSNVIGRNVIGCFIGFAVDRKQIIF